MGTLLTRPRKAAKKRNDTQAVLDSFRRIVQALRIASRAAEQEFGLSAAQLFVLNKLADGKAASLNELAARTLTHQSTVSVVVQRLVQRGLVRRSTSAADGRQIVLDLTARGSTVLKRNPRAAQDKLVEAITGLSMSDRKALARVLTTVANTVAPDAV